MRKLGCVPYVIDVSKEENCKVIADWLEKRGSKFDEKIIKSNSFILCNQYDDVWFQELGLVAIFD